MTLDTRIYVKGIVPLLSLFTECNRLLDAPPDAKSEDIVSYYSDDEGTGDRILQNAPGQGLSAWLQICYNPDGPYLTFEDAQKHTRRCRDYECEAVDGLHGQPCVYEISLDTAYGYRGLTGEGCTDLHRRVIRELGEWLDYRNVPWAWQNEFTGETVIRYDGLEAFA